MMNSSRSGLVLFSGNGNTHLSNKIAEQLGMKLGQAKVTTFSDGEISISVEENVRGKDVFHRVRSTDVGEGAQAAAMGRRSQQGGEPNRDGAGSGAAVAGRRRA